MNRVENGVWPLLSDPAAPWNPPWPDDDLGFADHLASPIVERLDAATYRARALRLQDLLTELARGGPYDRAALDAAASAASVPLRPDTDRRPVSLAPFAFGEAHIARLALDARPDAGQRAADGLLGPRRLALCPQKDRQTFIFALSQWALSGPDRSVIEAWTRSRQAPDARTRAAVRAIWQAPVGLWRVRRAGGEVHLEDRVGIDPRRVPVGPVDLRVDRPVDDGDAILARLVPMEDGSWRAFAGLRLSHRPSDARVRALVHIGLARLRLRRRRSSLEDLLRHGAHGWVRQWMIDSFIGMGATSGPP